MKMKQPEDNMELEVMRAFNSRKSDQEIGMPDVEQELSRLKARMAPSSSPKGRTAKHHPPLSNGGGSLRKIAAILVAALMLTGFGYAAVRTSFFTRGWDEAPSNSPKEENLQASAVNTNQNTPPLGEVGRGSDTLVLFKDVRLDSIMMQIDQHYQVTTRFTDESIKGIRMLLKWNPKQPLDEVLDLLNGFERLKVYREKDELIIENP